jgi:hypothetical protein
MPGASPPKKPANGPVFDEMDATAIWVAVTPGALDEVEPPVVVDVAAVVVVVAVPDDDEHPVATPATTANDAVASTQLPRVPRI